MILILDNKHTCKVCGTFNPSMCSICKHYVDVVFNFYNDNDTDKNIMTSHFVNLIIYHFGYNGSIGPNIETIRVQANLLGNYFKELEDINTLFTFEDYEKD